jgi:hypothetical protein
VGRKKKRKGKKNMKLDREKKKSSSPDFPKGHNNNSNFPHVNALE